jgi:DNA-directed RNA polymerase specialized sigma24 family protein
MVIPMRADSSDVEQLVQQAAAGDPGSWAELIKRYRSRLRRMVSFRMDSRLQGRVDPSDVVQEVCLEAWQHLGSLRHLEQLTASEASAVLGIKEKAAGMRYVRALRRLKEILTRLGGWGEP